MNRHEKISYTRKKTTCIGAGNHFSTDIHFVCPAFTIHAVPLIRTLVPLKGHHVMDRETRRSTPAFFPRPVESGA